MRVQRVYDPPEADDGTRVLVDRVWPRGLTKEKAAVYQWIKEIAPSTDLRQWFGHEEVRWPEFQLRYRKELDANPEPVAQLRALVEQGPGTLLFAAHETRFNNAVALRDYLAGK